MLSRKVGLAILGAVIILAGAWYFLPGDAAPEVTIETAAIDRGDITRAIATSGTVNPLVTVEVGSQVSGLISSLSADFNTPVKAGQVVAQIDPQSFEQRVTQARADFSVAEANIDVQKANIAKAESRLKEADRALERAKQLRQQGNVSIAALDTAEAAYESAIADVNTAKAQLRTAEANLVQRQAALSNAEIDLGYTQIRSPIDGIVIRRAVSVGQTVAASMQTPVLFEIAQDLTKIQIEASVDEADIGSVKAGNTTNFTVDAYPDRQFRGEVTQVRLAPEEEQSVVTYTVVIAADNPNRALLPGMTANVEIITGKSEDVLRVRNEALRLRVPESWDAARAAEDNQGRPGGFGPPGGVGGGGSPAAAMLEQLPFELSDEKKQAIGDDLRTEMQAAFAGGGFPPSGGFDPAAMRQQMEQRIASVMSRHLTDEQLAQFEQYQAERMSQTVAELWVINDAGEPERRPVRLGITDNRYTEVLGGPLEEGDEVITRVTERTDG